LEARALEARVVAAEVVVAEILGLGDGAGQEAAAERAVGDQPDPELADRGEHLVLEVACPQRVLALQRADRMDGLGAPDRGGRRLREAEVADLALLHQLRHRPHRLLDRNVRINAVLVVEIDVVHAEAAQRALARAVHVLGAAVDPAAARVFGIADDPELGGQDHLVAPLCDGAPDQLLVGVRPVHVRCVQQGDPEVEGELNRGQRFGLVSLAVELGHPHAAESLGRHFQSLRSQLAMFHALEDLTPRAAVALCQI
jgi:hypothetical protein